MLFDIGFDSVDDCGNDFFGVSLACIFAEGFLDGFNELEFAAHEFITLFCGLFDCVASDIFDPKKFHTFLSTLILRLTSKKPYEYLPYSQLRRS